MTSNRIPFRAKPPAFSAAIFSPFWETRVAHFWVDGWCDPGSQQHARTHSDTHAQYNTEVNSSGTETSLWTNERTTRSVLRRCAQRPTTGRDHYLTFWSDWRETEDITEKKNALPVTPFPNSLNLTWALGISEYFRYSFKEKKDSQLQLRQIWLFTIRILY